MKTVVVYVGAAVAEIVGCFAFWAWLRLGKPIWWLLPGVFSLIAFAYLLTLVETEAAGRAYATYGVISLPSALRSLSGQDIGAGLLSRVLRLGPRRLFARPGCRVVDRDTRRTQPGQQYSSYRG